MAINKNAMCKLEYPAVADRGRGYSIDKTEVV